MLQFVNKNGLSLKYASEKLRNDREVVSKSIERNGKSLKYASSCLQNDKEFLIKALSNGLSLQ